MMVIFVCLIILYGILLLLWLSWFVAVFVVFFFKQKTEYELRIIDWSSDVCSSDLNQLDARIGKPARDELLQEQRAHTGRHEDEDGIGLCVAYTLQEGREVGVLQGNPDRFHDLAALLLVLVDKALFDVVAGAIVRDQRDDALQPVLDGPGGDRKRRLRSRHAGAREIVRLLHDGRGSGGGNNGGNLRLVEHRRDRHGKRSETEAHQHAAAVIDYEFLGNATGPVCRSGVVAQDDLALLVGDPVAI